MNTSKALSSYHTKKYRYLHKIRSGKVKKIFINRKSNQSQESVSEESRNLIKIQNPRDIGYYEPVSEVEDCSSRTEFSSELETFKNISDEHMCEDHLESENFESRNSDANIQERRTMCNDHRFTPAVTLREKIYQWTLDNLGGNVKLKTVTQLLQILRSEGFADIPPTVHNLLGFDHLVKSKTMLSKSNDLGSYIYLGIKNGLINRIVPEIYTEEIIKLYIHIDGASLYKSSRGQLWPILAKIHHPNYTCTPFVVAIYHGNGKPRNVGDFMNDFVKETKELLLNGMSIKNKFYSVEIPAIICDGQARAFIKCIKGPTGYFACERCCVKGIHKNKKRVYPETYCAPRTQETFRAKTDQNHHKVDCTTPLLSIPVDPVNSVPLDCMHLLFLNDTKFLLSKWFIEKNCCKVKSEEKALFQEFMTSVTPHIPREFQRKVFDTEIVTHWKATQYAFVLLYVGGIALKQVLPKNVYRHFLHLHVACRILCSFELAVPYANYANELLRTFFEVMPTYYGPDCQTLNWHLLIHLAEDVKHFKAPITDYSAFFGENFLGKLQNLVTGKAKPLAQIVNKLRALEFSNTVKIKKQLEVNGYKLKSNSTLHHRKEGDMIEVKTLELRDFLLQDEHPNNMVELQNGKIFKIKKILVKRDFELPLRNKKDFYIEGYYDEKRKNVFKRPCPSEDVGIVQILTFAEELLIFPCSMIRRKCVYLKIQEKRYSISMLHL